MYLDIVVKVFTTRLGIESDSFPPPPRSFEPFERAIYRKNKLTALQVE